MTDGSNETRQGWERAWTLFHAAVELSPDEREDFISRACSGNEELLDRVQALLDGHEDEDCLLDRPPQFVPPLGSDEGDAGPMLDAGVVLCERFEIARLLGQGGMGAVYEARDRELGARVAVKILRRDAAESAEAQDRFRRELRLSRRVTHPNACRVFDLFQAELDGEQLLFLTMELLPGETLSERLGRDGPLSTEEALPIVRQVVAALTAAHSVGVVHRDLKASNVMLVPDDGDLRVVVMDFGIATSTVAGAGDQRATQPGLIIGSPATMAPEQLRGGHVTAATDVYALGLLMYEMLTGELPFPGDTPIAAALKRLEEDPLPPRRLRRDLPSDWERCILRCLEREPVDRFSSPRAVLDSLVGAAPRGSTLVATLIFLSVAGMAWGLHHLGSRESGRPAARAAALVPTTPDGVLSLSLLPLSSREPDGELLALATRRLSEQLARVEGIELVASATPPELADLAGCDLSPALGVDLVLRGRVRRLTGPAYKQGDLIRIEAELWSAAELVWTGRGSSFEWVLDDEGSPSFETLVDNMALHLFPPDTPVEADCPSDELAIESWRKGEHFRAKLPPQGLGPALEHFRTAAELDPYCARAHAAVSAMLMELVVHVHLTPADACSEAAWHAKTALRQDPDLAEAHAQQAWVSMLCDWDLPAADETFREALDIAPVQYALRGASWLASMEGQHERAVDLAEELLLREPTNVANMRWLGVAYWLAGRTDRAVAIDRQALAAQPDCLTYQHLNVILITADRLDESTELMAEICEAGCGCPEKPALRQRLAPSLVRTPLPPDFEQGGWGYGAVLNRVSAGDRDGAFAALEATVRDRQALILFLGVDPRLDSIRDDPRFTELLERLGLTDSRRDGS